MWESTWVVGAAGDDAYGTTNGSGCKPIWIILYSRSTYLAYHNTISFRSKKIANKRVAVDARGGWQCLVPCASSNIHGELEVEALSSRYCWFG